jgi:hypothetical protein
MTTPPASTTTPYDDPAVQPSNSFESNRSGSIDEDLDIEDPLSRVYTDTAGFEPFSKSEQVFLCLSFFGVVLIPSIYLLVTKLVPLIFETALIRLDINLCLRTIYRGGVMKDLS